VQSTDRDIGVSGFGEPDLHKARLRNLQDIVVALEGSGSVRAGPQE
jgi:hypothetical protein